MIQAALNGARPRAEHPALPCTPEELALDAKACVAVGAGAIHMHPRDAAGNETLDPMTVFAGVRQVKTLTNVPVGVSTGAWIEPDLEKRLALIRAWYGPDYASVNCSEDGAIDVMYALISAGIGIEVGIGQPEEVEVFARSLLVFSNAIVRILVEPAGDELEDQGAARARFDEIHGALDRLGIMNPRLQHTDGPLAWFGVRDALRRGWDTRIGFEDTLRMPRGRVAESNAELVQAAKAIRGADRQER
jgi:uncharacterized protein (DUF849 family)